MLSKIFITFRLIFKLTSAQTQHSFRFNQYSNLSLVLSLQIILCDYSQHSLITVLSHISVLIYSPLSFSLNIRLLNLLPTRKFSYDIFAWMCANSSHTVLTISCKLFYVTKAIWIVSRYVIISLLHGNIKKNQRQIQKLRFIITSTGLMTQVQSLTIDSILKSVLSNHFKGLNSM